MPIPHQVTITGVVFQNEGDAEPDDWAIEAVLKKMIAESVRVSSAPMTPQRKTKRAYTCSICGGRHSATHCPHVKEIKKDES